MFNRKGQLSIEVLIILIFLITFIYVYDNLAEQTVYSLEVSKIKVQETTIGLSLNEFLEAQRNILKDTNVVDYNASYRLQNVEIASRRINDCFVDINTTTKQMIVQTDFSNIYTDFNIQLDSDFNLPERINCGTTITCKIVSSKIDCG